MKAWTVVYETRQPNAIGIFEPRTYIVRAETSAEATRAALDQVHAAGLEGRFPVSVSEASAVQP